MLMTMTVPDNLATRLTPFKDQIPHILELGLREYNASAISGLSGAAEILEFIVKLPTPADILALRPSERLQAQITALLEKNRSYGLTPAEKQQWEQYQYLEHLVRIAKTEAYLKLKVS